MKSSILVTVVAVISAAVSVSASYKDSCGSCHLEKRSAGWLSGDDQAPVLICDCTDKNGHSAPTKLDLNSCLANIHGFILPQFK